MSVEFYNDGVRGFLLMYAVKQELIDLLYWYWE